VPIRFVGVVHCLCQLLIGHVTKHTTGAVDVPDVHATSVSRLSVQTAKAAAHCQSQQQQPELFSAHGRHKACLAQHQFHDLVDLLSRPFRHVQTTFQLFNQTLYVGKDKVGINTLEPGFALTVWDEEIELGAGKRKRDVGFFGIMGRGDLILTANAKDNIVLGADGSVQVESIKIKNITIFYNNRANIKRTIGS
jgi:hypothetical protein